MSTTEIVRADADNLPAGRDNLPAPADNLPSLSLAVRRQIVVFGTSVLNRAMLDVLYEEAAARGGGREGVDSLIKPARNVDFIDHAFFGVRDNQLTCGYNKARPSVPPNLDAYVANPSAGTNIILRSDIISSRDSDSPPPVPPTLPLGVLAFGSMRRYWYAGETVDTPMGYLDALCTTYNVPLVNVEVTDPDTLRKRIGGMLALSAPAGAGMPLPPDAQLRVT